MMKMRDDFLEDHSKKESNVLTIYYPMDKSSYLEINNDDVLTIYYPINKAYIEIENDKIESNKYIVKSGKLENSKYELAREFDREGTSVFINDSVKENYWVIDYQNWEGEVIAINEDTFKAKLKNTNGNSSVRLADIKKSVVDNHDFGNIKEGSRFNWIFKRIKTNRGQEKNQNKLFWFCEPRKTCKEIEKQVSKEMEKLSFLFSDDE